MRQVPDLSNFENARWFLSTLVLHGQRVDSIMLPSGLMRRFVDMSPPEMVHTATSIYFDLFVGEIDPTIH